MLYPEELTHHEQGDLRLDPTRLLVAFEEVIDREEASRYLGEFDLRLETGRDRQEEDRSPRGPAPSPKDTQERIHHVEERFWVRSSEPIEDEIVEKLVDSERVDWVSPVYQRTDIEGLEGYLAPIPNVLLVEFGEKVDDDTVNELEDQFGLQEIEWKSEHLLETRYYRVAQEGPEIFDLRDQLANEADVADVRFEFMSMVSPFLFDPDDTHFPDQWDIDQISAPDGWDLTTGDTSVTIGIIDSGVEDHEDLNLAGTGFNVNDGTDDGSPVGPDSDRPHGTAVAGIAAAMTDNAIGVAGVGGNCSIHSVALLYASSTDLSIGINQAANTAQVDVINMSLRWPSDPDIDAAVENAHDNRDVVLCAATGNANVNGVNYPASHDDVIAVGASDQNDERKRPASPDGECWWGSNWGTDIDVVAPGVLCWSTDLLADEGYNDDGTSNTVNASCGTVTYPTTGDADGDYTATFNGTSAATPHVSGLAGLLRSLDPSLPTDDVRAIIERTCDKVSTGTYTYSTTAGKPNGTWNNEMGYGRINVHSALSEVLSVELTTDPVTFANVPEGHTTNAAAVFDVRAPFPVDLEITSGPTKLSGPGNFLTFDPPGTETTVGPTGGATVPANVFLFFEAGTPGSTTNGTVTIECPQTRGSWDIDLTGQSVTREDAGVVLVLDHSGSMGWSSGVIDSTGSPQSRMQLLQDAVDPLLNLLENDDGVGAVAFSDDATTLEDLANAGSHVHPAHRVLTGDKIDILSPDNMTSIAEGIVEGDSLFDDTAAPEYTYESLVIFTDGHDNPAPGRRHLTDPTVQNAIDERVFAIGMGTPSQLQPTTLQAIADGTGGYFQFTGNFSDDDIYRLRKYFLQVLVGATNADIVVDPERRLQPGNEHRIPFDLTEADVEADVIVLTPRWQGLFDFRIETPDGKVIDPGVAASAPGISHFEDETMQFYRLQLPVVAGPAAAHGGQWHAVLAVDEGQFKEFVGEHQLDRRRIAELQELGLRYSLSAHARSNVRMRTTVSQDSMEPGATLSLRVVLTEYALPIENRASVEVELTRPDDTVTTLSLSEAEAGIFEETVTGSQSGIYRFYVRGQGKTISGRPFTREDIRTAGLWNGGDAPDLDRDRDGPDERLCRLLECLLDGGFDRMFEEFGVDRRRVRRCVERYCDPGAEPSDGGHDRRPVREDDVVRLLQNHRTADIVRSLSKLVSKDDK